MSKKHDQSLSPQGLDGQPTEDSSRSRNEEALSLTKLEEEILHLLIGREMYGLQIVQAYEEASQGTRKLSVGTLYPTLSRMEGRGLLTSHMVARPEDDKGGARRKLFRITLLGSRALTQAEDFRKALHTWQPI